MNEQFKVILQKIKVEEYEKEIAPILLNNETIQLEITLDQKLGEKLKKCNNIIEKIKSVSKDGNFKGDYDEIGNMKIHSESAEGKEKEFNKNLKLYKQCSEPFANLDKIHQRQVAFMNNFTDTILGECMKNTCMNSFSKDNNEIKAKNCIRDCYRYDKINKMAMVKLMNDEYMKYIKALDKL
jgi:hypothetical protein